LVPVAVFARNTWLLAHPADEPISFGAAGPNQPEPRPVRILPETHPEVMP
jgi:hypothetical protein